MAALEFFTVVSAGIHSVGVDFVDSGTDPDLDFVYAFVDFVPRLPKGTTIWASGLTIPRGVQLDTIRGRYDIDGVLRTIIGHLINEKQTVTVSGSPTSITLTVPYLGGATTASIAMTSNSAAASLVQTRLEALPNVGVGNVFVSGANPWSVNFRAGLAGINIGQMTGTPTGGTAPVVDVDTVDEGTFDNGVKLVANTAVLDKDDLIYDVVFSVPYKTRVINPFAFAAPTVGGATVDLASVNKLPPKQIK